MNESTLCMFSFTQSTDTFMCFHYTAKSLRKLKIIKMKNTLRAINVRKYIFINIKVIPRAIKYKKKRQTKLVIVKL